MRAVGADGCTPAPLFLHKRSAGGDITLKWMDQPRWWACVRGGHSLCFARLTGDSSLVGKQFSNVSNAEMPWVSSSTHSISLCGWKARGMTPSIVDFSIASFAN